jgi:hypothetical protein
MYEISVSAESSNPGITRIDVGPYRFPGTSPLVKYPEAVTNEMCPPGWSGIKWVTDKDGASWLRYEGGVLTPDDGEVIFRFTSNFPPAESSESRMVIWNGKKQESYRVTVPDYSSKPPRLNSRHDCVGQGRAYSQFGCMPQLILGIVATALVAWLSVSL